MTISAVCSLTEVLPIAQSGGYAVGAFSSRYLEMMPAILRAGMRMRSPLIIQLATVETIWFQFSMEEFAERFFAAYNQIQPDVPVVLHLDHTSEYEIIARAIKAGFRSVMIDASTQPLEENIRLTRAVVDLAHAHNVSVEAELGRITSVDGIESGRDDELYTDPAEAEEFVRRTQVDALAVSVGTYHGVYPVRVPRIALDVLTAIRARIATPMVLHGGSGVPAEEMHAAIRMPGGGVSKINIATDLELALLNALGCSQRLLNSEFEALPPPVRSEALTAVEHTVAEKMQSFLLSAGRV